MEHPGLVAETEDVAFTAEGRFLAGSLYGSGLMRIPKEVKEVSVPVLLFAGNHGWLDYASSPPRLRLIYKTA